MLMKMEMSFKEEGSLKKTNDLKREDMEKLYSAKYNSAATIKRNYPCKERTHKVKVTQK